MALFTGKKGLILGVLNDRSIAWSMAEALYAEGATLGFTHMPGEKNERRIRQLIDPKGPPLVEPCDVQNDEQLDAVFARCKEVFGTLDFVVHAIAFANTQDIRNPYAQVGRAGWHLAMDVSAYSLVAVAQRAAGLMPAGGSIVSLTYFGGEKVIPGYNLMGVCKAALEHSVRYLAWDLGDKNIRVNAISAGPVRTISAAGVGEFDEMRARQEQKAALRRNIDGSEVGRAGLFLLSELSSGVTGETLHVDAGFNIMGI